jgi:hypothetical protein
MDAHRFSQDTSDVHVARSTAVSRSSTYTFAEATRVSQPNVASNVPAWQAPRCDPLSFTRALMRQKIEGLRLWLKEDLHAIRAIIKLPEVAQEIGFFGLFLNTHFATLNAACKGMVKNSLQLTPSLQTATVGTESLAGGDDRISRLQQFVSHTAQSVQESVFPGTSCNTPVFFSNAWLQAMGGVASPTFARAVREPWHHLLANIACANQSASFAQAAKDVPFPTTVVSCLEITPTTTGVMEGWIHCEAMELVSTHAPRCNNEELATAELAGDVVAAQVSQINAAISFVSVLLPFCK